MKPKVKEAYVTREKPVEIFSIIENALSENINTQIFVDDEIYEELKNHGNEYNVFKANYENNFHYYSDFRDGCRYSITKNLKLTQGCFFDPAIAYASFVSNTKEYQQIVSFGSAKIKDYNHYCVGFKQLLLIHFETESK